MTKDEYIARLEQIKRKCQKEVNELGLEYAKSNNPYQVGDTIKDHMGAMVIERVQPVLSALVQISYSNVPVCRYYGVQLKKDGTPMKRQDPTRSIYQSNIIDPK